ncbi:GTP-binding protein [Colwellia psychrerythraea]|uniref:GTP-binding protein n=1 Tax=Colwellia psychrerythraea TaxID=28229 RepID=A0A1Y5EGL1_COLPS|nr:GTP-binding protein [Colwellia psychrerythraea]
MTLEKHDLHHEFPDLTDEIHHLKINDNHFARLFNEYHETDHEVNRIEQGVENTSDEYLDGKKKQRLKLKDKLFVMLKKVQIPA